MSEYIVTTKYLLHNDQKECVETIQDLPKRVANALVANEEESKKDFLRDQFLFALKNGAIPAGRILSNAGADEWKPATSMINCLAGETPVLTKWGTFPIDHLAKVGNIVHVLNGNGVWSPVTFKSYGKQPVYKIYFKCSGVRGLQCVRATKGHRWVLSNGKVITTEYWMTGKKVDRSHPQINNIVPVLASMDNWKPKMWTFHGCSHIPELEEVYCCTEAATQSFVILNGLLTGNCVLSGEILDSMDSILTRLKEAGLTLKKGCGIGMDWSCLRPKGSFVKGAGADTSGPISFMHIYDAMCLTISSAGGRRGAQMATLDIRHPDILDYISAKRKDGVLTQFNMSVLITTEFMEAVEKDLDWKFYFPIHPTEKYNSLHHILAYWPGTENHPLRSSNGKVPCKVYKSIKARELWDIIMKSNYEYAEPGLMLIDNINEMNNLWWVENIRSTNPCGEQPLPPYGACLLGSIDLTKFVKEEFTPQATFDFKKLEVIVPIFTRMLDNVADMSGLPLEEQLEEIRSKRRHGMGFFGLGSALTMLGIKYGSDKASELTEEITQTLAIKGWETGVELAKEKGMAPILEETSVFVNKENHPQILERLRNLCGGMECVPDTLDSSVDTENITDMFGIILSGAELLAYGSKYLAQFPQELKAKIATFGSRFTHHTSIAPTGTIALGFGNNASSGIEPTFAHRYTRALLQKDGTKNKVTVYSSELLTYVDFLNKNEANKKVIPDDFCGPNKKYELPQYFITADQVTPLQHLKMQAAAQKWVDSSISKCVIKGTFINTNLGIMPIERLGNASTPGEFAEPLPGLKVIGSDGDWHNVTSHYNGGIKKTIIVYLSNGQVIEGAEKHKLLAKDEWKRLDKFEHGDEVVCRLHTKGSSNKGGKTIPKFDDVEKGMCYMPKSMDCSLSLIVGLLLSNAYLDDVDMDDLDDAINPEFLGTYQNVLKQFYFKYPTSKGTNSIECKLNTRWLHNLCGYSRAYKFVPDQIMCGSNEEKNAFLLGLSTGCAFSNENGVNYSIIYNGVSKVLRDQVFSIIHSLGCSPIMEQKYLRKNTNLYSVGIKRVDLANVTSLVDQPQDNIMLIPKSETMATNDVESLSDPDVYTLEVIAIGDGEEEVYDIEVEGDHTYLIDGVVSHNTINVPENFPFEDFKDTYLTAVDLKLKGCTLYKPNPNRQEAPLTREDGIPEIIAFQDEDGSVKEFKPDQLIEHEGKQMLAKDLWLKFNNQSNIVK